jgi:hypothetical protein
LVATRGAVFALIVWTLASSARAHPDYLAYFNELAGDHPDRVLVDSDLDWGQDLDRLSTDLRTRGINNVSVAYFGTADLKRHALPPFAILKPYEHVAGWVAISITTLTKAPGYGWLSSYQPTARIGRSIELFDIPGTTAPTLKTAVAQERLH